VVWSRTSGKTPGLAKTLEKNLILLFRDAQWGVEFFQGFGSFGVFYKGERQIPL
jgi:hypothetical protein